MPKHPLKNLEPKNASERSAFQGHMVAASGEFVGTFMFLLLAFCGHTMAVSQSPSNSNGPNGGNGNSTIVYISLSYGISLLITAWTMYRVSGGLFNPAVTLGMVKHLSIFI